jgi:predicted transcriptional regulator of viral defense system
MNTIIEKENRGIIKPSELPIWLLSRGIITVTTEECAHLFNSSLSDIPNKLVYLRNKNQIVALARGLWAVVPTENIQMGAPEPVRYIDSLMSFYGCNYCAGWLTAAALYGASHQAPQVFQVVTSKTIKDRKIGRSELKFYERSYVEAITKRRLVISDGVINVPTVGSTMLMLCADILMSGGIDNVATIISELSEVSSGYVEEILNDAHLFQTSAIRRLGWILENVANITNLDELKKICDDGTNPSLLSPYNSHSGSIDTNWHLVINRKVDKDI